MTIREIADTAGCNERTVRRIVGEKWPAKIQNGKVTRFTWDEAHELMGWLPKKNKVDLGHDLGQMSELPSPNGAGDRMDRLEAMVEKLVGAVIALSVQNQSAPRLAIQAPQIKPRDHVNQIVRKYADREQVDFSTAWGDLYREFGYRTNSSPKVAAKNRGMGVLDYLESEGLIDTLEAVALEWARVQ